MTLIKKIYFLALIAVLVMPLVAAGDVDIDFDDGPVPVPFDDDFTGPAAEASASGLIMTVINLFLTVVGLIAVAFVILGGFRYVTAHGNEEQAEAAKRTILHAVIGIVVVIMSFAVIRIIGNALTAS